MQLYHQEGYFGISGRYQIQPNNDPAYPMDPIGNRHGGNGIDSWSHTGSRWINCRILLFPTKSRRPLPGPRERLSQPRVPPGGEWPIRKKHQQTPGRKID